MKVRFNNIWMEFPSEMGRIRKNADPKTKEELQMLIQEDEKWYEIRKTNSKTSVKLPKFGEFWSTKVEYLNLDGEKKKIEGSIAYDVVILSDVINENVFKVASPCVRVAVVKPFPITVERSDFVLDEGIFPCPRKSLIDFDKCYILSIINLDKRIGSIEDASILEKLRRAITFEEYYKMVEKNELEEAIQVLENFAEESLFWMNEDEAIESIETHLAELSKYKKTDGVPWGNKHTDLCIPKMKSYSLLKLVNIDLCDFDYLEEQSCVQDFIGLMFLEKGR